MREKLFRLDELEKRERTRRYERWHIPPPPRPESDDWLITYLDLVTLLLVLLVAMLSLAGPGKLATFSESVRSTSPLGAILVTTPTPASQGPVTLLGLAPGRGWINEHVRDTSGLAAHDPDLQWDEVPLMVYESAGTPWAWLRPRRELPTLQELGVQKVWEHPLPTDDAPVTQVAAATGKRTSLQHPLMQIMKRMQVPTPQTTVVVMAPEPAAEDTEVMFTFRDDANLVAPKTPALPEDSGQGRPLPTLEELGLADLGDGIDVIITQRTVNFRISNEILFESAQADLTEAGLAVLERLASVLANNPHRLTVEGHTDNRPIFNNRFPSNWELSTNRATSVLRYLERHGVAPQRLRAVGYADTRPIASNDTAEGRAANRRVEIIMEIDPESSSSSWASDPAIGTGGNPVPPANVQPASNSHAAAPDNGTPQAR